MSKRSSPLTKSKSEQNSVEQTIILSGGDDDDDNNEDDDDNQSQKSFLSDDSSLYVRHRRLQEYSDQLHRQKQIRQSMIPIAQQNPPQAITKTKASTPPPPPPPIATKSKNRLSSALKSFRSRKTKEKEQQQQRHESDMFSEEDEDEYEQRRPFITTTRSYEIAIGSNSFDASAGLTAGNSGSGGGGGGGGIGSSGQTDDDTQQSPTFMGKHRSKASNLVKKLVGRKPKKLQMRTNSVESGIGSSSSTPTSGKVKRYTERSGGAAGGGGVVRTNISLSEASLINIDYDVNVENQIKLNRKSTSRDRINKKLDTIKNIQLQNYNVIKSKSNDAIETNVVSLMDAINQEQLQQHQKKEQQQQEQQQQQQPPQRQLQQEIKRYIVTESVIDTWPTTTAPNVPTTISITKSKSESINMNRRLSYQHAIDETTITLPAITVQETSTGAIRKYTTTANITPTIMTTTPSSSPSPSTSPPEQITMAESKIIDLPAMSSSSSSLHRMIREDTMTRGRRLPKSIDEQYYKRNYELKHRQQQQQQQQQPQGNNLLNINLSGNIKSSNDIINQSKDEQKQKNSLEIIDPQQQTQYQTVDAPPKIQFEVGKLVRAPPSLTVPSTSTSKMLFAPIENPQLQIDGSINVNNQLNVENSKILNENNEIGNSNKNKNTNKVLQKRTPTIARIVTSGGGGGGSGGDDYYYSSIDTNKSSDSSDPKSDGSLSRRRIAYVAQPSAMIDDIYDAVIKKNQEQQSESIESDYSMSTVPGDGNDADNDIDQSELDDRENMANTAAPIEKREHLYKILVIGELGAGKTSFIKRYVHQFFSQNYRATIGVDFALKVLNWDQQTIIRLQLWDIAGQERFGNMTRVYYKEAVGAFIVFDVTRSATFDAVVKWKQDLDSKVQLPNGKPIPCILLANKCDQQKQGLVNTTAKMDEYVKENGFAGWYETSAKENINIEEAARSLVNKILLNDTLINSSESTDSEKFGLNDRANQTNKKNCAC